MGGHDEIAGNPTGGYGIPQKPLPKLYQLLTKSGIFNLYLTKDLSLLWAWRMTFDYETS